jgi:hypothetical protein
MISRIIEAKPEEMRVFIEEAAGISKYKERRRETSNRIKHTRENLDRLKDLLEEVEKQLKHLDRQAKTAERYGRLKEEERRTGDVMHVDFQAVSRDQQITAEIPVHLANEEDPRQNGGIVNLVLYTVPLRVRPLEVPQEFVLDLAGTEIGDVRRMSDLADQLPEGAEFELEDDVTIVTITAPMSEEELDELAEGAGIEEDEAEPELVAEGDEPAEGEDQAEGGADAEGDGDTDE